MAWVASWTGLLAHLLQRCQIVPIFQWLSNVYMNRQMMLEAALAIDPRPEFILWIDSDNIVALEHFDILMQDIKANPEAVLCAAWCWVASDFLESKPAVSGGYFDASGSPQSVSYRNLMDGPCDLYNAGWTGFPAVLMRTSLLERLPAVPFAPVIGPQFVRGFSSDDTGFCCRAKNAGLHILIDRRLKIPHLKEFPAEPKDVIDSEGTPCQHSDSGV